MDKGFTDKQIYEFGEYSLDPEERIFLREGQPVQLPPKAFDLLLALVRNSGRLITKDDLMKAVWHDSFVEESNLTLNIHTLRKIFNNNSFIETVPKKGYRFNAEVRQVIHSTAPSVVEIRTIAPAQETGQDDEEKRSYRDDSFALAFDTIPVSPQDIHRFPKSVLITVSIVALVAVISIIWFAFRWNTKQNGKNLNVRSLAVLPFKFVGNAGKEEEYLKVGLADALITRLGNSRLIAVRPTSAILKFDKQETNAVSAGKELQVESVIEGNIQRVDDRVRVTVQLVRVEDGATLWADKFEELTTNALSVQDMISAQVVRALALRLSSEEESLLAKRYTANSEAQKLYLQGRFLWNQRTPDSLKKSIEFFEQAKAKDPQYALAYVGLADSYQLLAEYRVMKSNEAFSKARASATKALEIDPNLAEAHTSLGYTLAFYDWNWDAADKEFKKAIELNPNYATARQWYSEFLMSKGRFDESIAELKKAQELDPLSLIIQSDIAGYFYITRQYDQSIEQSNKVIELDPNFAYGYIFLWISYEQKGMQDEAIKALLKAAPIWGESQETVNARKIAYEKLGVKGYWEKIAEEMERPERQKTSTGFDRAMAYLRIGDKEKTFEFLKKSFEARERWLININQDPQWDSIRSDPRFVEIVQKIGL